MVALMPWPLLFQRASLVGFYPATAAIMRALRLLHGPQWTSYAGLRMPLTHVLLAVAVFGLVATGTKMLLPDIPALQGRLCSQESGSDCFQYIQPKVHPHPI